MEGVGTNQEQMANVMVNFARAKILCSQNLAVSHRKASNLATLALLDIIIHLDFEPRREAAHGAEAELVASHMRIAYSIP